ncbi:MAG: bestrophin family ion channel [Ferruginibacter sp.]
MISYNTKEWFTFIFRFHRADTFRKLLPLMIGIGIYSAIIAYLELEYWNLSAKSYVSNLPVMHTLLGFAISMLLVFRTNTAYDRWWEARKLWGSLELIAEEIEDPFGGDENDLPTDKLSQNIHRNVEEIL